MFRGLSEESEVNERHDSQPEKKCVCLQLADLKQSQERAEPKCATARPTHSPGVNNPAIEESCDARQQFLSAVDQPFVKFVDVETAPQKIDMQRIALTIAVKPNGNANA